MATRKWTPEQIRKSHVLQAAKEWRQQGGYKNFRNSLSYDVIIDGMPYPPKAISSRAHELATGKNIETADFGGARGGAWHRRLKELGFDIVAKGSDKSLEGEVARSLKLSRDERLKKLVNEVVGPAESVTCLVRRYKRSPHVVAERLFLANGICNKCKKPAPFKRKIDGSPYLEVHHIKPLSLGGPDSVENTEALCPNCHSKRHDDMSLDRAEE